MTQDEFIDLVATRVIERLKIDRMNRREYQAKRLEKLAVMRESEYLSAILYNLAYKRELPISKSGSMLSNIRVISKLQILQALRNLDIKVSSVALSAELAKLEIVPARLDGNNDPRHRIYVNGQQTQCYIFDSEVNTLEQIKPILANIERQLAKLK